MTHKTLSHLLGALLALALPSCAAHGSGGTVNGVRADAVVAQDGTGDCKTVQAAFDAVPANNEKPYTIYVRPGTYKEKLLLTADRPFVHLVGASAATTTLTYGDYARQLGPDGQPIGTSKTPSVTIKGHDFQAENLTFENTAGPRSVVAQAVALTVEADRSIFRHCRLLGHQDTLYANKGRQFYQDCLIAGDVDFIFGNAAAVFQGCTVRCLGKGYVTAHSRLDAATPTGYVFVNCAVTGSAPAASVALGRPWRSFARVVYLGCALGGQVRPEGWLDWSQNDLDREKTVTYAEYADAGPGTDPTKRVAWSHQLTADEAGAYLPQTFLKGDDGWDPAPPVTLAAVSANAVRQAKDLPPADPAVAAAPVPAPAPVIPAPVIPAPVIPAPVIPAPIIPAPIIPDRTFSVTAYGAVGDGKTLTTAALQKAIDACAAAGGGTVDVPPGRYLTAPLTLANGLNLHLEKGATLAMSPDPGDFPLHNNRYQDCLSVKNGHDIALTGPGAIDGQGNVWWANFVNKGPHRPFLVVITNCQRVLIQGVTLENSPMFHLVPQRCRDVTIDGVTIQAPDTAKNTDGLDPSGWNFLITHCTFNVGDDCIAVKPSGRIDPSQPACKDFLIEHCAFQHGHGLSVGGQTPGGLDGMTVRDCTFTGTDAGIRLKASRGAGGLVQNLVYEDLTMTGVKNALDITSYYNGNSPGAGKVDAATDPAQMVNDTTPIWRHIQISRVTATGGASAGRIVGLPEMPAADITLTDVRIAADRGLDVTNAQGVRFVGSSVTARTGPAVATHNAQVTGLNLVAGK